MLKITLINPNTSYQYFDLYQKGTITSQQCINIHLIESVSELNGFNFDLPSKTIISVVYENGQEYFDVDAYSMIHPKKTLVEVVDVFNNTETIIFRGRIIKTSTSFDHNGMKTINCEDYRGFMKDSFVFYSAKEDSDYRDGSQTSYIRALKDTKFSDVINQLISLHGFWKSSLNLPDWASSGVTSFGGIGNEKLKEDVTLDGSTIWEAITTLTENVKGEVKIANVNNQAAVLQFDKKLGATIQDPVIRTGLNLQSITKTENMEDGFTAIMPLGGYGYHDHRLSLSDVEPPCPIIFSGNATVDDFMDQDSGARMKLYVENVNLVALYGLHIKVVIYDDVVANNPPDFKEMRQKLVDLAKKDAKELAKELITFDISAADLYKAGITAAPFQIYNSYTVIDTITETNIVARLVQKDTNFDNPAQSSMTFEYDARDTNSVVH